MPVEAIIDEIEPRARQHVGEDLWDRAIARARYEGCDDLARIARAMLETRRLVRGLVGVLLKGPEQELAAMLADHLPLGPNEAIIGAARGLQLAGIVACVGNGLPLRACACYSDVVDKEAKPMLRQLLRAGVEEWSGLGALDTVDPDLAA